MRSGKRKGEAEMDEIERTELIGRLRKLSVAWAELGYWESAELITKAAREIKKKQERTESPWISTAARLTEEDELVLAIVNGWPVKNVELQDAYELARYTPAEGWMPLPEPPEDVRP